MHKRFLISGSLFDLAGRFETEIAEPLRAFLDSVPNASPAQLIAQFDFLDPVNDLAGGLEGVKLNLDLQQQFESSIAALLEPITARAGGLIDAVAGDALATALPFDLSLDGFSIDVIRDPVKDVLALQIPDFKLDLLRRSTLPLKLGSYPVKSLTDKSISTLILKSTLEIFSEIRHSMAPTLAA